ncbi:Vitamin K-dependent protein C (Fragment) [Seminavis robusta]|uniref:Vitamin K-dependent protein C n=1 Tax=Seminavis robusta TaxID=568900 RepID=A0A9N8DEE8_9STRA
MVFSHPFLLLQAMILLQPALIHSALGSSEILHLRRNDERLQQSQAQQAQYPQFQPSSSARSLEYERGSFGSLVDVPASDFTDASHNNIATSHYRYNERDWNVQVDTGGPFVGPQVFAEPRSSRNDTTGQSYRNNNAPWYGAEPTKRIIGGYEADPHPFHSMLLLRYGGGWRWAGCGGTLISNCHVLTAAHCTVDPSKPVGAVFVNAHRPYQDNQGLPFHFSDVQHVTRHAGFNSSTNQNDIAVIKMTKCLNVTELTEFPPAIPAAPTMQIPSQMLADILGFGKLSEQGSLFFNVEALQRAQVPVISQQSCRQYYGDRVKEDMFCGGFAEGGVDACQGDSGSSMTFEQEQDGTTVILGVISWGVGCGRSQSPGVYASVQYHYDWIARQVCTEPETGNITTWCSTETFGQTLSPITGSHSSAFDFGNITEYETLQPTALPATYSSTKGDGGKRSSSKDRSEEDRSDDAAARFQDSPSSSMFVVLDPLPTDDAKAPATISSSITINTVETTRVVTRTAQQSGARSASSFPNRHQHSPIVPQSTHKQRTSSHAHRSGGAVSFWADGASGCKPSGNPCWLGNECCSGICRHNESIDLGGTSSAASSSVCLSANAFQRVFDDTPGTRSVAKGGSFHDQGKPGGR